MLARTVFRSVACWDPANRPKLKHLVESWDPTNWSNLGYSVKTRGLTSREKLVCLAGRFVRNPILDMSVVRFVASWPTNRPNLGHLVVSLGPTNRPNLGHFVKSWGLTNRPKLRYLARRPFQRLILDRSVNRLVALWRPTNRPNLGHLVESWGQTDWPNFGEFAKSQDPTNRPKLGHLANTLVRNPILDRSVN